MPSISQNNELDLQETSLLNAPLPLGIREKIELSLSMHANSSEADIGHVEMNTESGIECKKTDILERVQIFSHWCKDHRRI